MLVGKSRGGTPFCQTGKTVFSKKNKLFVYDSTSWGCVPQPCRTRFEGFSKSSVSSHKPQENKSFLIQQFFKNAGEVQGE